MSKTPPSAESTAIAYSQIAKCRACGNGNLIPILDLGVHALTGRFPRAGEPDPPVAPLQLLICDTTSRSDACGLVQLAHSCDLGEMYGPTYGYRSSITKTMVEHLHRTVGKTIAMAGVAAGDWVLEIGSNDGTTQKFLANRRFNLVATDPSAGKFAQEYPKETRLIVDFFSRTKVKEVSGDHSFKAVVSIAMFYDLERPVDFMADIRSVLAKDGIWCTEQAYLPATLSTLGYDTVCHEHLNYHSLTQFMWMAKQAGLRVVEVDISDVNGGSFAAFLTRDDSTIPQNTRAIERILASEVDQRLTDADTWARFAQRVRHHRARVRNFFEDARAAQRLVLGLGASTKANVVFQYAGIDAALMPAIAERDPKKVGLRTPQTNIPIISEQDARERKPDYFFVGPWHFRNEICVRERPFFEAGGKMIFPLPRFEIVRQVGRASEQEPRIHWGKPTLFDDERAAIGEALDSTMISGGSFVDEFERRFAALHGCPDPAVSTNNGTTAIQLAYLALGIGPGDEIIVPGWGFMAAANMALAIGATPVFADIDGDHWMIDPDAVMAKITPKTKAIVATHTYGQLCDLPRLASIAKDAGIALIEDCAESLGSKWSGKMCGTFGDVGTFSFQATKTITCGEGGAILCRSPEVAARARLLRSHAMAGRKRYWHHAVGHNFRLTNIQCAMLCTQLSHWDEIVLLHQRLGAAYERRLKELPVKFQSSRPEVEPVLWAVGLRLVGGSEAKRDRLIELLAEQGIECRPGFYSPNVQPIYKPSRLPQSDAAAAEIFVPPVDPTLSDQAFDDICDALARGLETL